MPDWEGCTLKKTLREDRVDAISHCFEPFKAANWDRAFSSDSFDDTLVNCLELRDFPVVTPCGWTMMHYAAANGAPAWVPARLVELGATRCAKDSLGQIPRDIAVASGHSAQAELLAELTPQYTGAGSDDLERRLDAIEGNFHKLIREVTGGLADEGCLALPPVRALLETHYLRGMHMNFPVPGMYGGFYGIHLEFGPDGRSVSHLLCESWCRVVGGSGRRDRVTPEGIELLESGFV